MNLSKATLEQLYAELERREQEPAPPPYRWVCAACGNTFVSGARLSRVYLVAGTLYCDCRLSRPSPDRTVPRGLVPMHKQAIG
ncbi:hypothetical protein QU481_14805 [Crenobacter sp. SG2303]|uniref:Recombinase zinc beta ribbon domain-containing protein n=1 Tax=Crenobacter oryzisoli TaxID=3056844 RepID=A0ABT7XQU1_9NEIS|nr:hypothetical protein [Crenobacter sp. SG2303]MDN0076157.1 hypothetical protein [Crenobacter sp. SG2303]